MGKENTMVEIPTEAVEEAPAEGESPEIPINGGQELFGPWEAERHVTHVKVLQGRKRDRKQSEMSKRASWGIETNPPPYPFKGIWGRCDDLFSHLHVMRALEVLPYITLPC